MGGVSALLKRLEVKPTDDDYETIETSRWGNRDVYPIAHDKRTYGVYAYVSYWGEYLIYGSSKTKTNNSRHVWNLSLIVDDWKQSNWYWLDSRPSHGFHHRWDAYCVGHSVS